MGDDFRRCKYTELDYTEHKIGGVGWYLPSICGTHAPCQKTHERKSRQKLYIFLLEVTNIENESSLSCE